MINPAETPPDAHTPDLTITLEGMEGMMSNMSEEERKAMKNMKKACMKMMQSHGSDHMDRGEKDKDA